MKKLIFLIVGIVGLGAAFGQSNKVVTAFNLMKPEYNELDKAKLAIDEASVHPKTMGEAKTWYYRGMVYYKIYQSKDEKYKSLDPDPLKQAYLSYVKAAELDVKKRFETELLFEFTRMSAEFFNKGSAEFEAKKFKQSFDDFETVIGISKLPYINKVDTGSYFNAALAAEAAGMTDQAIEYYNKAISLNYGGADIYHYLAESYLHKGDSATALKTYEAGIAKFPNTSANLYIAMINFYLARKDVKSAFTFIEKAVEKDSLNTSLWQVYGRALEDRDKQKAIDAYKNMIRLDPKNFNGYYNVGTVYFNMGVEANDKANAIPLSDEAGYKAALVVADNFFKQALPFFEKAFEINQEDGELLSGLKQLYYRFKMNDKLAEIQKRIDEKK